ncbi:uncharacterized protein BCR38DRAFT_411399 [Pseudomassariella vexata]|uniref:Uncharacterized protein n=1 Tax=Pseudomassariella vexata TaxID=1141098 RepID=A0A1Y2DS84_9PEZI|nr:uncharacterized protein BCR38DRAFT_411399 [Pseudomassariella vexata]ORY61535.1 hypothetical protein BCR38DRAFT_411399 [Pseudomassariella vexata]
MSQVATTTAVPPMPAVTLRNNKRFSEMTRSTTSTASTSTTDAERHRHFQHAPGWCHKVANSAHKLSTHLKSIGHHQSSHPDPHHHSQSHHPQRHHSQPRCRPDDICVVAKTKTVPDKMVPAGTTGAAEDPETRRKKEWERLKYISIYGCIDYRVQSPETANIHLRSMGW